MKNGKMSREELIDEIRSLKARISALEGLEKKLKRNESLLEYAQRIAHLGNWTWDIVNDNFFGSREAYRIFEMPPGIPMNLAGLMEMVHPEDSLSVKSAIEDGLKGAVYKFEFRIISQSGWTKHVQVIGELESRDGIPTALNGTIQDITERKELENEQKRLIGELQYAQRTAHLGDWVWNIAEDNFFGSQESYNIFDLPLGTPVSFAQLLDMVHPEDRDTVKAAMDEALHGALHKVEFRIITGKGQMKYIQAISELESRDGKKTAVIGTIQDVTEKKELENEQKRLITELQNALGRIKTLSGLLPICANCKRIRDERGNWSNVEKYIETHSEAEFTHSLCPECEEKLYGEEKKSQE